MEKIVDFKLKDFFKITDVELLQEYLFILDLLQPLKIIKNPKAHWFNKNPKNIEIKSVRELKFGEVITIRNNFKEGYLKSIIESVSMVSGLKEKQILRFTITQFYGIISFIKEELVSITNMEINELTDDSFDYNLEQVNAKGRMEKFGIFNTIDNLANENILDWEKVLEIPYMTVFTKLKMDYERNKIQQELVELQKEKSKK